MKRHKLSTWVKGVTGPSRLGGVGRFQTQRAPLMSSRWPTCPSSFFLSHSKIHEMESIPLLSKCLSIMTRVPPCVRHHARCHGEGGEELCPVSPLGLQPRVPKGRSQ